MSIDRDNAQALIAEAREEARNAKGTFSSSGVQLFTGLADALEAALSAVPVEGEVEWGVLHQIDGGVEAFSAERYARDYASGETTITEPDGTVARFSRTLVRRAVGPWEEVRAFDRGICGACQERPYGHDNFECDGLGHGRVVAS